VSEVFPLPSWQNKAGVPLSANPSQFKGRGVPDVAGDADPASGYQIIVDGQGSVIGSTSERGRAVVGGADRVAQPKARTFCRLAESDAVWSIASLSSFHDIRSGNNDISGNNDPYAAVDGWDPTTGLGSPGGAKLLATLIGQ
jgi:kumamolisin